MKSPFDGLFDTPEQRNIWGGALQDIGNIWTRTGQAGAAPNGLVPGGNLPRAFARNRNMAIDSMNAKNMEQQMAMRQQGFEAQQQDRARKELERQAQMQKLQQMRDAYMIPGQPGQLMGPPEPGISMTQGQGQPMAPGQLMGPPGPGGEMNQEPPVPVGPAGQMIPQPGAGAMNQEPPTPPRAPQTLGEIMQGYQRMSSIDPRAGLEGMAQVAKIQKNLMPSAPMVSIGNIGNKESNKAAERIGTLGANRLDQYMSEAQSAAQQIPLYDQMEQDLGVFKTGVGGDIRLLGNQMNAYMGGDPAAAAAGERIRANQNLLTLTRMGPMKGGVSDKETAMLRESGPAMSNSVAGNLSILAIQRAAAQRLVMKADMAEEWFYDNNGSMKGFNKHYRDWVNEQPMPEMAGYRYGQTVTEDGTGKTYRYVGGPPGNMKYSWEEVQ